MAFGEPLGRIIASILTTAWRHSPEPLELSAEQLSRAAPSLLGSGAGALGWWRVRDSDLRETAAAHELRDAYRQHSLHSVVHEDEIKQVLSLLRSGGIEPVLVKGWSAAGLYPLTGLRPYGDIDLCCAPEQYQKAKETLSSPEGRVFNVDLHNGLATLDERRFEDLLARSRLVTLSDTELRVFAPEDELRILCLHLLRHRAWRPLWLCDVSALVESRCMDFNWDVCLGDNKREADWVLCTVGLAGKLLGARVDGTPAFDSGNKLPTWLLSSVLMHWETYPIGRPPVSHLRPMRTYLTNPDGLWRAIYDRWPDPIAATVTIRGNFNAWPRIPDQLGGAVVRFARFLGGFVKSED